MTPRFATDVVTFYHPDFWELPSPDAVRAWALAHPELFWARVMDALDEAGVTGIELTFAPGDIESALRPSAVRRASGASWCPAGWPW